VRSLEVQSGIAQNGLVRMTSGNISGRDAQSGLVVIKPSGYSYEEMTAGDMVIVDPDGASWKGT